MWNEKPCDARWGEVCLDLVYEPEGGTSSHPSFLLRGVLLYALSGGKAHRSRSAGEAWTAPWTWRVEAGWEDRVWERGRVLAVTVVTRAGDIRMASDRLREAARRGTTRNFRISRIKEPVEMSMADAVAACPCPEWETREDGKVTVEFSFHSPWEFRAVGPDRLWDPGVAGLAGHVGRAAAALGEPDAAAGQEGDWERVDLVSEWWEPWRAEGPSRSQGGQVQRAEGWRGPLYVRLPVEVARRWWPWWVMAGRWHLGAARPLGQGHMVPGLPQPWLDGRLGDATALARTWESLASRLDPLSGAAPLALPGEDTGKAIQRLAEELTAGTWLASPAVAMEWRGKAEALIREDEGGDGRADPSYLPPMADPAEPAPGGGRCIALLSGRDRLVHQFLHQLLAVPVDRVLSPACEGFRPGRGVGTALAQAAAAYHEGLVWAARTDVTAFFDEIPHEPLCAVLDRFLPPADSRLRRILRQIMATPWLRKGRVEARTMGVLQGSPLSPLLANLYLHSVDEALLAAGHRLIRYGDDLLIMAPTEASARVGLALAQDLLAARGLRLNAAKTTLSNAAETAVRYLGKPLGGAEGQPEGEDGDEQALLRPLYLTAPYQWAGCEEGGTLVIREGQALKARVPLTRVSEVILSGLGGLSTRLIEVCAARRIPLTLAGSTGRHVASLFPEPRSSFRTLAAHETRFAALSAEALVDHGAALIMAKVNGYRAWLHDLPRSEVAALQRKLAEVCARLATATDPDTLRGHEGFAARLLFPFINRRLRHEFFRSPARLPRERRDPWNVLLDCVYHLLFCRLHALLRSRSLNPYLGFLHSADNSYPSLVCDLQEAFRARCDRLCLRLINQGVLQPADFEARADGRWRLKAVASPRLIEAFEEELDRRPARDPWSMRRSLAAQCDVIRHWAWQRLDLSFVSATLPPKPPSKIDPR